MELLLVELADRLVRVEEAGLAKDPPVPAVHAVAGDREGALVDRLAVVVQRRQVEVGDRAHALAARTHAAKTVEGHLLGLRLAGAALDRHATAGRHRRDVERVGVGRADVRLAEPTEEDAQHRVGVGGGADRGSDVRAHSLLVDDDRRGQAFEQVDVRPRQRRHEALHEGAVGLVDQPLRLRGDRVEHQRALARAGDAGEYRQPALRDLDADVLEVVHARALHADQIVAVRLRRTLASLTATAGQVRLRRTFASLTASAFARRWLRSRLRRDQSAGRVGASAFAHLLAHVSAAPGCDAGEPERSGRSPPIRGSRRRPRRIFHPSARSRRRDRSAAPSCAP